MFEHVHYNWNELDPLLHALVKCAPHLALKGKGECVTSSFCSLCHSCHLQWIDYGHIQGTVKSISPAWDENISWSSVNTWEEEAPLTHWAKCCTLCNREEVVPDGVMPGDALPIARPLFPRFVFLTPSLN